jgi:hypothetical protein
LSFLSTEDWEFRSVGVDLDFINVVLQGGQEGGGILHCPADGGFGVVWFQTWWRIQAFV